ncbi:Two-component sensor histidine kinase, contains HisKA and HATPase domains [Devosia crocina]|uniref:histidine kinase n=1 Tax=Devosia crocina TaxID=429728 RepID=A0A1I7NTA9_9HYPH|nr:sensor histidine kinase [Devosia crocina]SFV37828.1 Two-component sensor histidine kinase, contains HisKA and HATPase domains [Devosia crocina]
MAAQAQDRVSEPAKPRSGRTRQPQPVARLLFALVLVILLPALIVSIVLLNRTNDAQEEVVQALTNATVQAMGQAVDREVAGMITTLRVLSSDQALEEGRLADFHQRAVIALAGTGSYLIGIDANGNQLLNTRLTFGEPVGMTSDMATAARAFERTTPAISSLFFGRVAQTWVYNVWLPLSETSPVRGLALTQNARDLIPVLQSRQLPEGWHAALVDGDNLIISATTGSDLDIGDTLPIRRNVNASGANWTDEIMDGERVVTAEWRSGLTGWRIVAWASAIDVQRPLGDSLLQLAAWGIVIAFVASIIAFVIAQQLSRAVRGLRLDAQRLGRGEALFERSYPVAEIDEVSKALALAARERQTAERDVRFLMRELAHRSKNQMAVISAMAKQTSRGATDVPSYVQALERRIMGLARSTDLLLAHGRAGVSLRELVDLQLAPFRPQEAGRITIVGKDLRINPQGAQILGMALHELAVNATQYGAFADEEGQLQLGWTEKNDRLEFGWREMLSRPLRASERSGFGTTVLRTMVGGALGAQVDRHEHGDGVEWRLSIPMSALDPDFAAVRPDEQLEQRRGE